MRRLRRTPLIRELVREVTVSKADLIQPLFVEEALTKNTPISSMPGQIRDRKSTRLNSSHVAISYAVFCLKKKKKGTMSVSFTTTQYMPLVAPKLSVTLNTVACMC